MSPVPTGRWVEVAFFPGFRYVAYRAREGSQVSTVSLCEAMPEHLVYHNHLFHVMDLKVTVITNILRFNYFVVVLPVQSHPVWIS